MCIAISHGNRDMARFRFPRATRIMRFVTSKIRRNITARFRSKMNCAHCCARREWNSTSGICGIDLWMFRPYRALIICACSNSRASPFAITSRPFGPSGFQCKPSATPRTNGTNLRLPAPSPLVGVRATRRRVVSLGSRVLSLGKAVRLLVGPVILHGTLVFSLGRLVKRPGMCIGRAG